jgi:hypothetical protein
MHFLKYLGHKRAEGLMAAIPEDDLISANSLVRLKSVGTANQRCIGGGGHDLV